jgi:hypothetical protein
MTNRIKHSKTSVNVAPETSLVLNEAETSGKQEAGSVKQDAGNGEREAE